MDVTHIVMTVATLFLFVASMILSELGRGWAKGLGVVCLVAAFGLLVAEITFVA